LDAIATIKEADEMKQAVAVEAARVLLAAGMSEAATAQEVVGTLVAADVVKVSTLADAHAAVDTSAAEVKELDEVQAAIDLRES